MTGNKKVKVAIAGVGNCASALLQGISFYGNTSVNENIEKGNSSTTGNAQVPYIPE